MEKAVLYLSTWSRAAATAANAAPTAEGNDLKVGISRNQIVATLQQSTHQIASPIGWFGAARLSAHFSLSYFWLLSIPTILPNFGFHHSHPFHQFFLIYYNYRFYREFSQFYQIYQIYQKHQFYPIYQFLPNLPISLIPFIYSIYP